MKTKLVFLVLCAGLVICNYSSYEFAFIMNDLKANIFTFYVCFLLIILLIILRTNKITNIYFNKIDICVLCFYLYRLLMFFVHKNTNLIDLISITSIFLYYTIAVVLLREEIGAITVSYILFYFILLNTCILLIFSLLQLLGIQESYNGYFLVTGNFSDPGIFAEYLSANFLYIILFTHQFQKQNKKLLFVILALSFIIVTLILYLNIRGAFLAILFTLIIYSYFQFYFFWNIFKSRRLKIACLGVILISIFLALYFIKKDSSDGRLIIWKVSLNIVKENFLVGVGINNFSSKYNNYQAKYFRENPEKKSTEGYLADYTYVALNDYIQLFCETGIFGILIFSFLVKTSFLYILNEIKCKTALVSLSDSQKLIICCSGIIFAILVYALVSFPFENVQFTILFFFFLAIISSQLGNTLNRKHYLKINLNNNVLRICILFFICISLFQGYKQTLDFRKLKTNISTNEIDTTLFIYFKDNPYYVINKMEFLLKNNDLDSTIKILEMAKRYTSHWILYVNLGLAYREKRDYVQAENNLSIANNMIPHLVYPKFLLALVYFESGQKQKFLNMSERVLYEKEKIKSDKINEMRDLIKRMIKTSGQNK